MIRIDRKEYLDFLIKSKDRQIIKVVSGVRRCGKSTLFEIYKDYLLENGIIEIKLYLSILKIWTMKSLQIKKTLCYIQSKMLGIKKLYFLDEIPTCR
ncbi:Uncharacterised protein [Fusobacterium necrophorum subsp. necrophorum]|nr:Uncharacterised protein [Fusobacterium necrophorum subsp. necrophorum]